jgi:hypothetical protein
MPEPTGERRGEDCDLDSIEEMEAATPFIYVLKDGKVKAAPNPKYDGPPVPLPDDE